MAQDTAFSPNPVINLALERFRMSEESESETRQNGVTADQFYLGDQWPKQVQQSRVLANRPCLVINQLKKFVRQITNDMRMNRPSVKVIPVSDADEETADILEGMVRHIQVASNADIAYDTAGQSQVIKGFGYFRVVTEYEDEDSFDQVIRIKRIKNAYTVYFDPNCVEPDYSDAKWCFIVEDLPKDEFKKLYPKAYAGSVEFSSTGDSQKDWQNNKTVRVAEYFEVVEKEDTLCMMMDGTSILKSDMQGSGYDEAKARGFIKKERETSTKQVLWRKITFCDILEGGKEGQEWPGKFIPVIPVLGEDMDVDGKRYIQGMVFDAMDPQRQFNYMSTAATEAVALAPKAPWLVAEGQMEGYERFYENANVQNFAYLPYKPASLDGHVLPPPSRNTAEPPIMGMTAMIQKASEDLKGVTGIFDAGLGNRSNETSGKAILARQREGDVANFNYIDNLSRAIRYLGKILIDLIPTIYDAPRIQQIIGEDDSVKTVHLNTPLDEQGNPLPQNSPQDAMAKIYDLSAGKYDVAIVVGPSFTTKRQEAADAMMSLVQAAPNIAQQAPDIIVKAMDFPLHNELADRLKKFLPPGIADEDDKQDIPAPVQAQLTQQMQMIEQMTQTLNQLQDEKDAKLLDLSSKERIAASANENKLAIAMLNSETSASQAVLSAELQNIASDKAHSQQLEMQANQPEPHAA